MRAQQHEEREEEEDEKAMEEIIYQEIEPKFIVPLLMILISRKYYNYILKSSRIFYTKFINIIENGFTI